MSASTEFRRVFSERNLNSNYNSFVRYKTAVGVDRVNTKSFEKSLDSQIALLRRKVLSGNYRFTSYREKLLIRGKDRFPRVLSIPTLRDKLTLKALCDILYAVYGRSAPHLHQIIGDVAKTFCAAVYDTVLRFDVKDYYPSIRHELLFKELRKEIRKPEILSLINNAITTPTVAMPIKGMRPTMAKGVPQGLSISNMLANLYMRPLDLKHGDGVGYKYYRYVDDILILCKKGDSSSIRDDLINDCKTLCLDVHTEEEDTTKAVKGSIADGFTYLGYVFDKHGISVREKSLNSLRESIIKMFSSYKYAKEKNVGYLKWKTDLRITGCIFNGTKYGWLFFFSQIDNLSLLHSLDHFVQKQCIRFNIDPDEVKLKKFVRSYHEIRKNITDTKYIPNFYKSTVPIKRKILADIYSLRIKSMTPDEIEYEFKKRLYRSVRELEKDLARPS